jgi:6-phosphogluconolactonase/glucosamine-6-phosphate isomerase/deaminase
MKLRTFQTTEELISECLETLRKIFPNLGAADGVMLAGGRTPLDIYRRAAGEGLSTNGVLFLSDERYVPAKNPQSNYGGIAPFFPTLVKIKTEFPIEVATQSFHNDLCKLEHIPLGLLGLGADGHTASLFNLKDAALRDERLAIPVWQCRASVPLTQNERDARSTFINQRISVTPTLLHKVEKILILATGAEKKAVIQTLLEKPDTISAGVALTDHPNVEIWTDQEL